MSDNEFEVVVYFEKNKPSYAEVIAFFKDENDYIACLPSLKKRAKIKGFDIVTESLNEKEI
jgi:hypothetical protein|tara:strand:- start:1064 stop:1246 length:183 start_codon:yes stop_codon:yes gene_type:complete